MSEDCRLFLVGRMMTCGFVPLAWLRSFTSTDEELAQAIDYARKHGVEVKNMNEMRPSEWDAYRQVQNANLREKMFGKKG